MLSQFQSERPEPKTITFPTDLEKLLWNAVLYLTIAVVGAALIKGF